MKYVPATDPARYNYADARAILVKVHVWERFMIKVLLY